MQQSVSQLAHVGDAVFVNTGERSVRTTLQGFLEGDRFLTQAPLEIQDDCTVRLQLPRQECVYSLCAVKEGSCVEDGMPLYRFRAVSEIERLQRRRAYRLSVTLGAEAVLVDAGPHGARLYRGVTLNLSEKGLCFKSGEAIEPGRRLRLRLDMAQDGVLMLFGESVHSERNEDGGYLTGVRFEELPQCKQAYLIKYIMKRQLSADETERTMYRANADQGV